MGEDRGDAALSVGRVSVPENVVQRPKIASHGDAPEGRVRTNLGAWPDGVEEPETRLKPGYRSNLRQYRCLFPSDPLAVHVLNFGAVGLRVIQAKDVLRARCLTQGNRVTL